MASATPSAIPEAISSANLYESPYNSRSVTITVGPARKLFTIHEAKLAETCFFKVHGVLGPANNVAAVAHRNVSPGGPEVMAAVEINMKHEDDVVGGLVNADYHIEDRFFLYPPAFDIFAKFLYNESPSIPTTRKHIKIIYQAYGIARKYECFGLQNKLVDCLRRYYRENQVQLNDLVWASNRFGDDIETPVTAFLVEQIAFEISVNGFDEFAQKNGFLLTYLQQGNRNTRLHLFKAMARNARDALEDPSLGRNRFYVREKRQNAGQPKS